MQIGLAALIETLGGKVPAALQAAVNANQIATHDMKLGFDRVTGAATDLVRTTSQISDKVRDAAERGSGYWRQMADDVKRVSSEVDAISLGHSPGGLKEIVPMLRQAEREMLNFSRGSIASLAELQRIVDGMGWIAMPHAAASARGAAAGGTVNVYNEIHASAINTSGLRELVEDEMGPLLMQALSKNRGGLLTAARDILGVR